MKKILSMTAITAVATLTLSMGVNANNYCVCSFKDYSGIINNTAQCCHAKIKGNVFTSTGDKFIDELLNECETIYKDTCDSCCGGTNNDTTIKPEKPETDPPQMNPEFPDTDVPTNKPSDGNTSTDSSVDKLKIEILDLVNRERTSRGLDKLSMENVSLSKAADIRAREQATLFSHTRPDGNKWSSVLAEHSIKYKNAGENVAYGQRTASEVMNAWMNSSGHKANILGKDYSHIGIGVYYKNGTYYWSQLFIG